MARVPVTYEQVAAVANTLYAAGDKNPGTKAIREELAKRAGPGGTTGSPNTIQRHLDQWRLKDKPVEAHEAPQLPAQLASDIQRALNAAASNARELVEERLAQVQGELAELASTGEGNEARIDELTQDLAARTSERDSMAGQLTERTSEVDELKTALAAATNKAASLERELHEAQTAAQEASGRVEEIRSSTSQQLEQLRAELAQARAGQASAENRAVAAEKDAVKATAHLEGERSAKTMLEAHVAELQATVKRLEPDAARAASSAAEAAALAGQVQQLTKTNDLLSGLVKTQAKAGSATS